MTDVNRLQDRKKHIPVVGMLISKAIRLHDGKVFIQSITVRIPNHVYSFNHKYIFFNVVSGIKMQFLSITKTSKLSQKMQDTSSLFKVERNAKNFFLLIGNGEWEVLPITESPPST